MATGSTDQFLAPLKAAHREWETAWRQRHVGAADQIIYHYTNAEGLLGIVKDRQLWASNAAFLNDSTELVYIRDVLAEVKQELPGIHQAGSTVEERSSGQRRATEAMSLLEEFMSGAPSSLFDVYVACFCSDGDLLSHWRGYPSRGGGYALGLRSASLRHGGGLLRRVVYDDETKRQLLRDLLSPVLEAVASEKLPAEEEGIDPWHLLIREHLGPVAASLTECAFCFKNPGFKEESEWRLVVLRSRDPSWRDDPPPLVRATPTGLRPYIARSLEADAIARVVVGPGSQPTLAADAAVQLLSNADYENARDMVAHSAIPLRV